MRRAIWSAALFVALLTVPTLAAAEQGPTPAQTLREDPPSFSAGEVLVRFKTGTGTQDRARARHTAEASYLDSLAIPRTQILAVEGSVLAAVEKLDRDPAVAFAQPNYSYEALAAAPDDTLVGELWGLGPSASFGVDAFSAWDRSTGTGVAIAVLDTGVDLTHPDLAPNLWTNPGQGSGDDGDANGFEGDIHGYDFIDEDGDPDDFHFHGTHVAGTAAAVAGNGLGIAGVAPGAKIMPVRVLDGNGSGSSAGIAEGIAYAAGEGARVLNLSLGGPPSVDDYLLSAAIEIAATRGAVVVAAAGNDSSDNDFEAVTPCNMPQANVICVAAVTSTGKLASFSNWGVTNVDVGAPGAAIVGPKPAYGSVVLEEDFESGYAGWKTAIGNGGVAWNSFKEGDNSLVTDSPVGDYGRAEPDAGKFAVSELYAAGPLDLSGERGCRLHFDTRYEIEETDEDGNYKDRFFAGADAEEVGYVAQRYAGTSTGFDEKKMVRKEASISPLDGQEEVFPLFAIVSDAAVERDGAYIDNLRYICRDETYVDAAGPFASWEYPGEASYFSLNGTSMATPHVAGVAALVLSAVPGLRPAEVVNTIKSTVRGLPSLQGRTATGGIVDAGAAVEMALSPPVISITEAPPALGKNRRPTVTFSANRAASFTCSVSGGVAQACQSPYTPATPLADGPHQVIVGATDTAGRSSQASASFVIDGRRPRVFLAKKPQKRVLTRKARAKVTFRLRASEPGVRFVCRIDGGLARFCGPKLSREFRIGKHVVHVVASDAAGNVSPAVVYRFKVVRRR